MRKSISSILFLSAILLSCGRTEKTGWVQPNIMETEKKNIGNLPALYPKPLTVVGAEVEGKVNWLVVGHTGIIGHDRILVSMSKQHYTNRGIRKSKKLSINLVSREMLPKADYVACVLPGTQETWHLFDAERLKKLKPDAILINAGRGSAIDSYALNNALRTGTIGGACLDVVEPEPLPTDHPLWEAPNLLLTPHISGFYHLHETLDRILAIALGNLRALVNGEPIRNVVDKTSGYRDNSGNNPISFS